VTVEQQFSTTVLFDAQDYALIRFKKGKTGSKIVEYQDADTERKGMLMGGG
jgi:hypothetical protein